MKTPSRRRLRPTRVGPAWASWVGPLLIAALWLCPLWALISAWDVSRAGLRGMLFPLGFLALLIWVQMSCLVTRRRLKRWAAQREGESLCTFARSLDFRRIDTAIIRAVYEAFLPYWDFRDFPLRPSDRWSEDLKVDVEELDLIALEVAERVQLSQDGWEQVAGYGQVTTVGEMVEFLSRVPREA